MSRCCAQALVSLPERAYICTDEEAIAEVLCYWSERGAAEPQQGGTDFSPSHVWALGGTAAAITE